MLWAHQQRGEAGVVTRKWKQDCERQSYAQDQADSCGKPILVFGRILPLHVRSYSLPDQPIPPNGVNERLSHQSLQSLRGCP